ncbi:MAG TPA: mandelate racemase [Porticoccaceae bacterium]|nr:mandelate racemase [Porticoccaceae bacterium]
MKILDVKVTVWEWNGIPPVSYSASIQGVERSTHMALLKIITDTGIEGHAFIGSALYSIGKDAQVIIDRYKPSLVGRNPLDRERIWQSLSKNALGWSPMRLIGGIDIALWDIAGKAAGVPIHQLMGGYRTSVPAYASSAVLPSPEAYAEEALKYKELGWTAYKIHPPSIPTTDIRICQVVRDAVGDDFRLMLDATWSYNYADAVSVGRVAEDLGFYWYEDPLPYDDINGYMKLKQALKIPIAATELPATGPTAYAPWILNQATDYLRGDPAIKGGLTSCLKTAHTAETFHMNYEVHHGGNSLTNVANMHLIMAIRNCEYFEVLLPDSAQKHGLVVDIEVDKYGMIHAPTGSGLGVEIDFDLIEHNKVMEL